MLQPYRGMAAEAPSVGGSPENRTAVRLVSDSTGHRCQPRCTPTPLSCASGMDVSVVARKRALSRTSPPSAGLCRPPRITRAVTPRPRTRIGRVPAAPLWVRAGQRLSGACPLGNFTPLRTGFFQCPAKRGKTWSISFAHLAFLRKTRGQEGKFDPRITYGGFSLSPELVPRSKPRWQGPGTRSHEPALGQRAAAHG